MKRRKRPIKGVKHPGLVQPETITPDQLAEAGRRLNQAYAYEENGELERALKECETAIRLNPSLAEAHNLLGIVLDELGYPREALRCFKRAVDLAPGFQEARQNLAELRAERDRKKRLVTVARFSHPAEAHLARTKLEAAGLWAFVADEHIVTMNWLWSRAIGGVRVQVRKEDVDRASQILRLEPYDPNLRKSGPQCSECHSFDVHYEKYAMRRVFAAFLIFRMPIPFPKKKWKCRDCGYEWKPEQTGDIDD